MRIGLISDTHGLLRPQALEFLRGCDAIVHGGDIGGSVDGADILRILAAIAPVTAVRGNNDFGPWADRLALTELFELAGLSWYALHDLSMLDIDPPAAGVRVVVSGHSHQPLIDERDGVLFVNPGSAGPRRFRLPIALAEVLVNGSDVRARVFQIAG